MAIGNDDGAVRAAMDALRRIVRVIRESSRGAEKLGGVSGAQVFVMHCLRDSGPLTISELALATMTHQSSVSVVVQRLVERGLVTRGIHDGDRRRREVALTAAGRRLLRRTPDAASARLMAAMGRMTKRAREELGARLVELVHAMGAEGEPAEMFYDDRVGDGVGHPGHRGTTAAARRPKQTRTRQGAARR